jgi:hypothetical protein
MTAEHTDEMADVSALILAEEDQSVHILPMSMLMM